MTRDFETSGRETIDPRLAVPQSRVKVLVFYISEHFIYYRCLVVFPRCEDCRAVR